MLRKPVRPELHVSSSKLAAGYAEILEHGVSQVKSLAAEHLWPLPSSSDTLVGPVTWKRINTETTQHGNASKKQNHKTNLMSSSLNLKLRRLYSTDFHSHGHSARSPRLF